MNLREHTVFFWGLITRWPRVTAIVIGGLAVFYVVYYVAVEAMPLGDAVLAGIGMALMAVVFKTTYLFVFYRFFHRDEFKGSFLVLAIIAVVPFELAIAISLFLARNQFEGPPPDVVPFLLLGAAAVFALTLGAAARIVYWIGGGGLRRR